MVKNHFQTIQRSEEVELIWGVVIYKQFYKYKSKTLIENNLVLKFET